MKTESCKLLIIGAGPGGYVCGVRAGQLGIDTIIVEGDRPGGTCLNIGCIPSKALIHAADEFANMRSLSYENELGIKVGKPKINLAKTIAWKNDTVKRLTSGVSGLLKKAKTRYVHGQAKIIDGKTIEVATSDGPLRITCDNLVIATGSKPAELSFLPFGGPVITSTDALNLCEVPAKLTIVGGGYIGLEIGTAMAKLGAAVTVVEAADRILPQYDDELTKPVQARLEEIGVTLHLSAKAKGLSKDGLSLIVDTQQGELVIPSTKILVTVGRVPATTEFGLEDLGLSMNERYISIDQFCGSSMRGVYAVGDVTGDPMLAHRAMAQGVVVAEHIAGKPTVWDKRAIPAVCFTDPEIATVGLLPEEVDGVETAIFPFAANGRAVTLQRSNGFVRIVFARETNQILGIQAVGANVSEMTGEFSLAIEMGATLTDIADTIHAHPTLSETVQEAALKGLGRALHQ